ncbi:hypothetical protein ACGYLO_19150 [Sulfitobacter sp. 1A13353]|uniref:hypothetical protein n=1 Tax=Sulfitobacter sp. 1A13353 TaxID=3368568 RepID=UPI003745AA22
MTLNPGDTADENSMITGAAFRDFYQNHWPKDFYVDDIAHEYENDIGEFILADDAVVRLDNLGYAVNSMAVDGIKPGIYQPMHWLWNRVMAKQDKQMLVAFHIAPDKVDELVKAAEKVGAKLI